MKSRFFEGKRTFHILIHSPFRLSKRLNILLTFAWSCNRMITLVYSRNKTWTWRGTSFYGMLNDKNGKLNLSWNIERWNGIFWAHHDLIFLKCFCAKIVRLILLKRAINIIFNYCFSHRITELSNVIKLSFSEILKMRLMFRLDKM